ncbi:MAG: diguanylate cyclase [Burkholderiales bacterium]|nr:diguanylate cyclase [Burkholderiales bacterium]
MPTSTAPSADADSAQALARQLARSLAVVVLASAGAVLLLFWLADGGAGGHAGPVGLAISLGWGLICVPLAWQGRHRLGRLAREITFPPLPVTTADVVEPAAAATTTVVPAATVSASLMQELIDAMDAGVVLWDNEDRLVLCNRDFRQLYADIAPALVVGARFEAILKHVVDSGLVPQAAGREADWIAERLRQHAQPQGTILREINGRWRRIVEQRLADGSLLSFSIDVSELVQQGVALAEARQSAQAAAQRLEDAIEALPDGFALYDADDRLAVCNTRYRAMYANSAPVLQIGTGFEAILRYGLEHDQYPAARGRESAWLAERLDRHRRPRGAVLQELPGNRWLRVDERITRDGGVAGVRNDVTELIRREQQLSTLNAELDASRAELQAVIQTAHSAIVSYDDDGHVLSANLATAEILGWREADLLGRPVTQLAPLPLHPTLGLDLAVCHRDGRELMLHAAVSEFAVGEKRRFVALMTDITDREIYARALRVSNQQLAELSQTDGLTGLANRRHFDRRLQEEWQRSARHGVPLALLMIDVDHFKRYNDCHGHLSGDDCLRAIAQALLGCARRSSDLVARYGGEEFAVLMPHATIEEAQAQAQRCIDTLAMAALAHGDSPVAPVVTLSIGVAHIEPGFDATHSPTRLLQQADLALYRAKRAGRSCSMLA